MRYTPLLTLFYCVYSFCCEALASIHDLDLDEKVGQLLMVHFRGEIANEEAQALIQDIHVGAIIYYNWSNGLHNPKQVRTLSKGLQGLARHTRLSIPLLIAIDQEGGRIVRLQNGFTAVPSNHAVALLGDPELAKSNALTVGRELLAVGVNMNLAPVADVNCNPQNPVIGDRAFSCDPEAVTLFAEKSLQGYKEAGIIAVLKHFPGHGDVCVDSHADLPIVKKSMTELESVELVPFAKLASVADAVMTGHLLVPAFDTKLCSTLSKPTLDYLSVVIGFQGIILSDSLVMEGVLKQCGSVEEAAIQALNAGCDILILGGKQLIGNEVSLELSIDDVRRIHKAITKAVESGHISEARLNAAVEKILKIKRKVELMVSN